MYGCVYGCVYGCHHKRKSNVGSQGTLNGYRLVAINLQCNNYKISNIVQEYSTRNIRKYNEIRHRSAHDKCAREGGTLKVRTSFFS